MASIIVRNLDDDIRNRLRVRAAQNGRSMEAEVRSILSKSMAEPDTNHTKKRSVAEVFQQIQSLFGDVGGVELDLPEREPASEPINFE